jgi:hypothetical protein
MPDTTTPHETEALAVRRVIAKKFPRACDDRYTDSGD